MNDKWFDKYKNVKFGKGLTKETAKARYENLQKEKRRESITCRETLVDIKFKQAMAAGEFDNVQRTGKPIDLSNYYDLPEHTPPDGIPNNQEFWFCSGGRQT